MVRIVLRILLCIFLVLNLILLVLSAITGVNVYEKYGKQILIGISLFAGLVVALYLALAMLGIGE